jgi:hypothetical protein
MMETLEKPLTLSITPATDADIIAYLRRSCRIAEFITLAEQDVLVLQLCEQLGITISDEELQVAGDAFRMEHKLLSVAKTQTWLSEQQITLDDWSQGIRINLLTKKLKEHLFGATVDVHYISNREHYRRAALSQILVVDLSDAFKIAQILREGNASFCALALEYSKGKQSQERGGFVGIQFLAELLPELAQALSEAKAGEIIGPIHTKLGYHILRVEKWFAHELNESAREQILEPLFQVWLQEQRGKGKG